VKEDIGTTPVYSMGVAERLTGLTGRQIRYWEQHGLISPTRTTGKQRMYSEADILKLKEIKRLLSDGMTMERVKANLARREVERLRSASQSSAARLGERMPRTGSLYNQSNRAELVRFIDHKAGK
jgi:MerR family glutamine synthetase transcriptional repressor